MQVCGITDVGLVRRDNQDAYAIRERTPSGHTVCVVCDGMGGTAGGQQASRIAVDTYVRELEKVLSLGMTPQQLREASSYAVSIANRAVRAAAQESEEYRNMGTTLVSAVSYGGGAVISNVGDSRAYHITPLTISVLYELINTRMLTHRPTIYTTNITDQTVFMARYTEKVASRMLGGCKMFKFFGADQRLK